mmetsp:Transcript_11073/g.16335  ORF Transcript_11073/g.16335 Transcript_11073/m.16335 type:complete len:391 (+) Transcript_11073:74-1246(+)
MREDYFRARVAVNLHAARSTDKEYFESAADSEIDPTMLFRVMIGHDKLSSEPKCGFDVLQLEKLFPEEMNAYQRWTKMHKSYEDKNKSNGGDDDEDNEQTTSQETEQEFIGGHLNDRLAQFDVRTTRMKEDWYMAFAEVRQGSFLAKDTATQEDRQWEETRRNMKKPGSRHQTNWEALPASSVQFLHWVGFDQRSALPPPNEETTQALGFLGYDFMGKIVEKAIFLKCLSRQKNSVDPDFVLELKGGEQLEVEDIERSLADTNVNIKPLYNSSNSVLDQCAEASQLYFGPGFEDRLEMEIEQMVMGKIPKAQVTEKEKEIRMKEDALFSKLAAPPTLLGGVMDVLGDEHRTDEILQQRRTEKIKQRINDRKKALAMSNLASPGRGNLGRP